MSFTLRYMGLKVVRPWFTGCVGCGHVARHVGDRQIVNVHVHILQDYDLHIINTIPSR